MHGTAPMTVEDEAAIAVREGLLLGEQGILVARRTVAKYREALSIPPVNLRKSL